MLKRLSSAGIVAIHVVSGQVKTAAGDTLEICLGRQGRCYVGELDVCINIWFALSTVSAD